MTVRRLRIGWDVGAWHCDSNRRSRDALCVVEKLDDRVLVVGKPWRGNLKALLTDHRGVDLLDKMLAFCAISAINSFELTIAIDAPLGSPRSMLALLRNEGLANVSDDRTNPYTRRRTEVELIERRIKTPLSPVRDMIGSQSTKAIHFLRAANLTELTPGVWHGGTDKKAITAIETYPAAVSGSAVDALFNSLGSNSAFQEHCSRAKSTRSDLEDALRCTIVAHLFADHPDRVSEIPKDCPSNEGWIVLPKPG